MDFPKNTKFKKYHKGKLKNILSSNTELLNKYIFGNIALIAIESGRIYPNQIKLCKLLLNKNLKKNAQIRFNLFTHIPITKKPLEVRMGKGKGSIDTWVANIFTGTKILEIESLEQNIVKKALIQIQNKLSIKTKIIYE